LRREIIGSIERPNKKLASAGAFSGSRISVQEEREKKQKKGVSNCEFDADYVVPATNVGDLGFLTAHG
jgi:hypothetical protein